MHKVLLSIGSNTNARLNLEQATDTLYANFPNIKFTNVTESEPFGAAYKDSFFNTLAYLETSLSKREVQLCFKTIEKSMGRKTNHKSEGKVIIDIDLIKWDNEVLKPEDLKRGYMNDLLQEMDSITNNWSTR